jgi:hypothetical protein
MFSIDTPSMCLMIGLRELRDVVPVLHHHLVGCLEPLDVGLPGLLHHEGSGALLHDAAVLEDMGDSRLVEGQEGEEDVEVDLARDILNKSELALTGLDETEGRKLLDSFATRGARDANLGRELVLRWQSAARWPGARDDLVTQPFEHLGPYAFLLDRFHP